MKRTAFLLTTLAAFTLAGQEKNAESVKKVTADQLKQMIAEDGKLFFLDVRSAREIEELGTIKGYANIPLDELEKRMNELPKDKNIVTA